MVDLVVLWKKPMCVCVCEQVSGWVMKKWTSCFKAMKTRKAMSTTKVCSSNSSISQPAIVIITLLTMDMHGFTSLPSSIIYIFCTTYQYTLISVLTVDMHGFTFFAKFHHLYFLYHLPVHTDLCLHSLLVDKWCRNSLSISTSSISDISAKQ